MPDGQKELALADPVPCDLPSIHLTRAEWLDTLDTKVLAKVDLKAQNHRVDNDGKCNDLPLEKQGQDQFAFLPARPLKRGTKNTALAEV